MNIKCKNCNEDLGIDKGYPYFELNNEFYCGDCAFICGLIDEKTLIKNFYYFIDSNIIGTPIIKNGKVEFVTSSYIKAKQNKDFRKTPEYIRWRDSVYKRDNFTCQNCHKRGGKLNAHHIKLFSKYKDLRFDIDNGITLCEKCHKMIHKKG